MLDESTSLSSCLIVYIRAKPNGVPVTFFLDLVELNSGTAVGIRDSVLDTLHHHKITDSFLENKWLGSTTDGCSTMLGTENGLVALLRRKFSALLSWHCSVHRLELSVSDAIKGVTTTNYFVVFMEKLYFVYSMSPKNNRELQ